MDKRKQMGSVTAMDLGVRWTPAVARRILDEWATSGESLSAFARRRGVHVERLCWWRKRLGAKAGRPVPAQSELAPLVPVMVRSPASVVMESAATIEVGSAIRVELRTIDAASASGSRLSHARSE